MSIIGHLRAVTPTQLRTLQKNPNSVKELLHGKLTTNAGDVKSALLRIEELAMQRVLKMAKQTTVAGDSKDNEKLRQQIIAELESAGVTAESGGEEGLTLEKSWHCLHYLLTGTAGETDTVLGKAILGGAEIGPDMGYGPARFLEPNEVKKVARALKTVSRKDLISRFNLEAMKAAKVYVCRDDGELQLAQMYFTQVCNRSTRRRDAFIPRLNKANPNRKFNGIGETDVAEDVEFQKYPPKGFLTHASQVARSD